MKKILFLTLIMIGLLSNQGKTQTKIINRTGTEILTPELLWKMKRVGGLKSSPDGSKLMYSVAQTSLSENKSSTNIVIRDVKTGEETIIAVPKDKVVSPRFRPDGKKIGYLSADTLTKGKPVQIWEMDLDGKNKIKVSTFSESIDGFVYSPKGDYLAYFKEVEVDKKDDFLYKDLPKTTGRVYDGLNMRHWDSWNTGSYNHTFLCKIENGTMKDGKDILEGQRFDSPVKPFGGEEQLAFTMDGKSIIYTCKKLIGTEYANSTNSDLYLYNIETGKEENLTSSCLGYDNDPIISPDGKYLIYSSMQTPTYESDKNRLMKYEFTSKKTVELTLNFEHGCDVATISYDGKRIAFITAIQGTKQIFEVNQVTNSVIQITTGDHDYNGLALVGDSKLIFGLRVDFSSAPELFQVTKGKEMNGGIQITNYNEALQKSINYGKVEKRIIKAKDGKDILTWVIYPPGFDATKKYPCLLYCQGGPQSVVSQFWSSRWNFQLMAANGYIVVAPNRRGLPSFGKEWNDAIIGDYGGMPMQDYLSAIDEVSKEQYVNNKKLGAVGASFGGYSVYWLAGNHNNRFSAFISHCGMFNMESWYGSTEEMFFANHDQEGPYWQNPVPYDKFSPHKFVKNWNTPLLVIHNEKDFRVPLTQGIEAFTAAQEKGIPSRFLYFPDENHWILKPQNSVLWHRVFFNWLDKYLK